jgi:hypothetical protein
MVLLKSAAAPVAVFWSAVLARSVPAAQGCVEVAFSQGSKRKETGCCVERSASKTKKRGLSFCRVATCVAAIRRWVYGLGSLEENKKHKRKRDENESELRMEKGEK